MENLVCALYNQFTHYFLAYFYWGPRELGGRRCSLNRLNLRYTPFARADRQTEGQTDGQHLLGWPHNKLDV